MPERETIERVLGIFLKEPENTASDKLMDQQESL
jgi:hypothetical protein